MEAKTYKDVLIDYLKSKSNYESIDDVLIDELVFNIRISIQSKEDMENGDGTLELMRNITRDAEKEDFFQRNRMLDIYNQTLKNITHLYVKLGISPQERIKLKIKLSEIDDKFDDFFGKKA